jgi:hypothetical protein
MRSVSNPNYVKFTRSEMIVVSSEDRGELRRNDAGEFFFRRIADGRFTCTNPDLERRLIDLGYRAGQEVGITRQQHGQSVIWKVRLVRAGAAGVPAHVTDGVKSIPESKYAPCPNWDDLGEGLTASITAANGSAAPPAASQAPSQNGTKQTEPITRPAAVSVAHTAIKDEIQQALFDAVDVARATQEYAAKHGMHFTFAAPEIQDLASTLYIQAGKQSNIRLMNRNNELRSNGGGDAWRH